MLIESLEAITAEFLDTVCRERWDESPTLDFKQELPGGANRDHHGFAKDVCAFANAQGGDLVFGIAEVDGKAGELRPIAGPADDARRRLLQILDSGLEPRVNGIIVHPVTVDGGYVLVVRVPASFDGPHCVRDQHNRRFVFRNGTGTSDMSYEQLRNAFGRTATLVDKAHQFIATRLREVSDGRPSLTMTRDPKLVVHLVPLISQAGGMRIDFPSVKRGNQWGFFTETDWGSTSHRLNLDGLTFHPGADPDGGITGYKQIHRSGALEAVECIGGDWQSNPDTAPIRVIWSGRMTAYVHSTLRRFIEFARTSGIDGPAIVSVALVDAFGARLVFSRFDKSRQKADRAHFVPGEVLIDALATANVDEVVRQPLDVLWKAFGQDRCVNFDATTGVYIPPQP